MFKLLNFALLVNVVTLILLTDQQAAESKYLNERAQIFNELVTPTEVFAIEPVLIYPKTGDTIYSARSKSAEDTEIIYVKLLPNKNCCRTEGLSASKIDASAIRDLKRKDFYYIKFLGNGQFSQQRLKVYETPQFYAINVYKTRKQFTNTEALM